MPKKLSICKYIKHSKGDCVFVEICSPVSLKNTAGIQFNIGSVNDSIEGLAHMTEHLITRPVNESNQNLALEKEGIKMNAYTYKERALFFASSYSVPPEDIAVKLITSFNWNPGEQDLQIEKNTILSELNEEEENANRIIFNKIMESCVKDNVADKKYLHNIAGNPSSVKKIKITDVKDFIQKNFDKPLFAITTAKKLSKKQVDIILNTLKASFKYSNSTPKTALGAKKNKSTSISFSIKNTHIKGYAFSSNDEKKNFIYLGLLKQYLGGNWSSIANQKMRVTKQLAYFVYAGMDVYKEFSFVYVQYDVTKENKEKAEKEVKQIFAELKGGIINEDVFTAAKNMRISHVYETFKNESDIIDDFLLSNSDFSLPTFYTLEEYLDDIKDVNIEDFKKYVKSIVL